MRKKVKIYKNLVSFQDVWYCDSIESYNTIIL